MNTVESIIYEESEGDLKSSGKSKTSKRSDKPEMTRDQCIEYHMFVENEKFEIMFDCIKSGKHAELKASQD